MMDKIKRNRIESSAFKYIFLTMPIAYVLYIINQYGQNVIFWDEYQFVMSYKEIINGENVLSLLFEQHNEHRLFFPRILIYLSAFMTDYNVKFQMIIGWLFLSGAYFGCLKTMSGKKIRDYNLGELAIGFIIGTTITSLCQAENILWGMQLAWFLIEMCTIFAMHFFGKYVNSKNKKYLILVIVTGTISCFSSLHGIATWLALGLLIMLVSIENRKIERSYLGIIGIAIIEIAIYFSAYTQMSDIKMAKDIGMLLQYFLMEIGSPMLNASNDNIQFALGFFICTAIIVMFSIIFFSKMVKLYIVPIGIIIFSMGVCLMCAIGRSSNEIGELDVMPSRYKTYSLLLLAAFIILVYKFFVTEKRIVIDRKKQNANILKIKYSFGIAIIISIGLLTFLESVNSLQYCRDISTQRKNMEYIMLNYKKENLDTLRQLFVFESYEEFYQLLDYMSENNLNVFADN